MKQLLLSILLVPFISFSQCPDGTFNSQAEIDALAIDYPNCTILGVSLVISGDDITDLSGLGQITTCTGLSISNNLVLQNTDGLNPNIVLSYVEGTGNYFSIHNNASLIEVTGLENLENQSGFESGFNISNNPMLTSIAGVPNTFNTLTWLTISNNDALINLVGLESYGGAELMTISNNDNLIDLTGLNDATVSESVTISDNDALESFNGLDYLGGDAHHIIIENNAVLEDINITNDGIGHSPTIIIQNNPSLSVCNANWVCSFIYTRGIEEGEWFPVIFENNAPGCNSSYEVEYSCGLLTNDDCGMWNYPSSYNYLTLGETIQANNEYATTSSHAPSCNEVADRQDVWFVFDSGASTTVDIITETGFNLQLWDSNSGSYPECGAQTQVESACNSESLIDIPVTSNTFYFVQVWSDTNKRPAGWFDLTVQDGLLSTSENVLNEISVYPNPIQNLLNVKANSKISTISVYNLLGQRVTVSQPNTMETQIDLSTLHSGLFLVEITIGEQKSTYKIIKE